MDRMCLGDNAGCVMLWPPHFHEEQTDATSAVLTGTSERYKIKEIHKLSESLRQVAKDNEIAFLPVLNTAGA